jgi:hypothetical protein
MQSFTSGASLQVHGGGARSNKLSNWVRALLCSGQSLRNEFPAAHHVCLLTFWWTWWRRFDASASPASLRVPAQVIWMSLGLGWETLLSRTLGVVHVLSSVFIACQLPCMGDYALHTWSTFCILEAVVLSEQGREIRRPSARGLVVESAGHAIDRCATPFRTCPVPEVSCICITGGSGTSREASSGRHCWGHPPRRVPDTLFTGDLRPLAPHGLHGTHMCGASASRSVPRVWKFSKYKICTMQPHSDE